MDKQVFYLTKKVGSTATKYDLINDNDKIMVALSGGKDSIATLFLLNNLIKYYKKKYEIAAIHIKSPFIDNPDLSGIEEVAQDLDIPLYYGEFSDKEKKKISNCFSCAWYRRKHIFQISHKLGYKKIAFGHHLDDVVETLLLNMSFNSQLYTMEAKKNFFKGEICIIRPLYLIHEKDIKSLEKKFHWKSMDYKCSFYNNSKRKLMKDVINQIYQHNYDLKENFLNVFEKSGEKFEKE